MVCPTTWRTWLKRRGQSPQLRVPTLLLVVLLTLARYTEQPAIRTGHREIVSYSCRPCFDLVLTPPSQKVLRAGYWGLEALRKIFSVVMLRAIVFTTAAGPNGHHSIVGWEWRMILEIFATGLGLDLHKIWLSTQNKPSGDSSVLPFESGVSTSRPAVARMVGSVFERPYCWCSNIGSGKVKDFLFLYARTDACNSTVKSLSVKRNHPYSCRRRES